MRRIRSKRTRSLTRSSFAGGDPMALRTVVAQQFAQLFEQPGFYWHNSALEGSIG